MLVLKRKVGEQIVIAGGITVTVLEVRRDKVSIGIQAPKDTTIMRPEAKKQTP
jgi:carbon storage regulator